MTRPQPRRLEMTMLLFVSSGLSGDSIRPWRSMDSTSAFGGARSMDSSGPTAPGSQPSSGSSVRCFRPSAGAASVAGFDVVTDPQSVRLRIGVALQDAAIDDRQTGRELLTLQGRLYGLNAVQIRKRLGEVLDLVDIGTAIDRRIGTYSGGMKRRLDLAAALVHNPEVLFLDEPTTGLDPHSRTAVWSEVRRLNAGTRDDHLLDDAVPRRS